MRTDYSSMRGYTEEGRQGISNPYERGDFFTPAFCVRLNNLQLDALRKDPEQSFDFDPSWFLYVLLSLYLFVLFVCFNNQAVILGKTCGMAPG